MKSPDPADGRPSVVWLYVSAAAFGLWALGMAVLVVLQRVS